MLLLLLVNVHFLLGRLHLIMEWTEWLNNETQWLNNETKWMNNETTWLNNETEWLNNETECLNNETDFANKCLNSRNRFLDRFCKTDLTKQYAITKDSIGTMPRYRRTTSPQKVCSPVDCIWVRISQQRSFFCFFFADWVFQNRYFQVSGALACA